MEAYFAAGGGQGAGERAERGRAPKGPARTGIRKATFLFRVATRVNPAAIAPAAIAWIDMLATPIDGPAPVG